MLGIVVLQSLGNWEFWSTEDLPSGLYSTCPHCQGALQYLDVTAIDCEDKMRSVWARTFWFTHLLPDVDDERCEVVQMMVGE